MKDLVACIVPENFINSPKDRQLMTLPDGVEAWAVDKVRSSESVRSLLDHLLENTFIVRILKLQSD